MTRYFSVVVSILWCSFFVADVRAQQQQVAGGLEHRLSDMTIATQIKLALVRDAELRPYDFTPTVQQGIVTLAGTVTTMDEITRAARVAAGVSGVRQVINHVITAAGDGLPAQPAPELPPPPVEGPGAEEPATPAEPVPPEPEPEVEEPAPPAAQSAEFHTVRSGESLWTISRRYNVSIDQIRRMNNLRSDRLQIGQRLKVSE